MPPRVTFNGPLAWSATALAVVALALLFMLWPVLLAAVAPGAGVQEVGERFAMLMEEHEADQETYKGRFNGRSIFFPPRLAPPEPVRRVVQETPRETEPPPRPPPPREYTGPSIRAIFGDEVWFHQTMRLSVGEEGEGVKVLSVNSPYSARLAYGGGEFEVPLFETGMDDLFGGAAASADPPGLVEVTPEATPAIQSGDAPPPEPGSEGSAPPAGAGSEGSAPPAGGSDGGNDGGSDGGDAAAPETPGDAPEQSGETPEPVKKDRPPVRSTSAET